MFLFSFFYSTDNNQHARVLKLNFDTTKLNLFKIKKHENYWNEIQTSSLQLIILIIIINAIHNKPGERK